MLFIVANINPNLYVSCTPLINVEALVHINVEVSSLIVPSVDDSKHEVLMHTSSRGPPESTLQT